MVNGSERLGAPRVFGELGGIQISNPFIELIVISPGVKLLLKFIQAVAEPQNQTIFQITGLQADHAGLVGIVADKRLRLIAPGRITHGAVIKHHPVEQPKGRAVGHGVGFPISEIG